ncbi:DegT/DnrJ/EryC1/StrS family aminotransferase [Kiritimatiella glycovorans]|uniref:UDP-4-amino-4-deoxy-L-arabinose--oxoglutarate aminotransferase n=1 Tax=Kiritimatiella glycovorans TaxID=1307763 RepID=A0A0G3EGH2_9BACT|nr:DegT/DnrJ/EryC1/StrS family aminotransferase [Kiritimatiella glycovorans]AKJ63885.1 UDP-4-amino-4-deoxy-L-arabinose--oxoglutarate aminotransferase [Kiritimatiella glycovorans]
MIPHSRPETDDAGEDAVAEALRGRRLGQGPETEALERQLEERFQGRRAVAVSSGTAALYLALAVVARSPEGEVLMPSFTCHSLYAAAHHAALRPVCVDLPPTGVVPRAEAVASRINDRTCAVILPHTCGFAAPVEALADCGLPVIEDCAQSLGGALPGGRPMGMAGSFAILSFYATKLAPGGEGGAVLVNDDGCAEELRRLRDCDKGEPDPRAFNFKMSDLHAALARRSVDTLETRRRRREWLADRYDEAAGPLSLRRRMSGTPAPQTLCFRYLLDCGERARAVEDFFQRRGIAARRPVRRPVHRATGDRCPRTEDAFERYLSIPLYAALTEEEADFTGRTLSAARKELHL